MFACVPLWLCKASLFLLYTNLSDYLLSLHFSPSAFGCVSLAICLSACLSVSFQELTKSKEGDNVLGSYTDVDIDADRIVDVELEPVSTLSSGHGNVSHSSLWRTYPWNSLTMKLLQTSTQQLVRDCVPLAQGHRSLRKTHPPWKYHGPTFSHPLCGEISRKGLLQAPKI